MMKTTTLLLTTLLLALPALQGADIPKTETRPNILLIVSEDNGPELGCYGDPFARTPNLDALASKGVRFNRAFVTQAGCSQSRASFLTGLYPHQHGQIGLATWGFRMYRQDTPNLPRQLRAAGYRTGIIGKLHVNPESAFPFDFSEISQANFARKNLGEYARHAEAFISASETPFFLSVNYPDAHGPFLKQVNGLPKHPLTGKDVKCLPYLGMDPPELRPVVADYYNCMSRLDTLIGDLLAALDRSGKAGNTLVIYLGDHGADLLRGKRTCYEGGLRIPLIIRWPGHATPQVREELVSTVDLMPTVLTACGAGVVPGLPGMPLQPLLAGKPVEWRKHLFGEFHAHAAAPNYFPQRLVRTDRFKLIENLLPGQVHPDFDLTFTKLTKEAREHGASAEFNLSAALAAAAPNVRAAYALMRQPPRYELYDLRADPFEFRNLAASPDHARTLAELSNALTAWRQKTGDPLLNARNLERLTAEAALVREKADGKQHAWGYPDYFFGRDPEPDAAAKPPPKKKKKRTDRPYPASDLTESLTIDSRRISSGDGDNWANTTGR
jgi:N-sulfoglucosamine sulfohydrolase